MSSSSRFSGLQQGPPIEPFLLTAQFKADKSEVKVNAGQGAYRFPNIYLKEKKAFF